jgi:hypothetical protein
LIQIAISKVNCNITVRVDESVTGYRNQISETPPAPGSPSPKTYSDVTIKIVNFLPEQAHVVYNSSDSSNFSTDGNGFIVPASTPALASTTLGEAVSYTFTTTAEASTISATPSFSFTYSLVDSVGSPASIDHLTFTTNGNALTVSGTIPANNVNVTPGTYTLTVGATIDSSITANASYTLSIAPRPLDLNPSSGVAQNVEIGFNENFTTSQTQSVTRICCNA